MKSKAAIQRNIMLVKEYKNGVSLNEISMKYNLAIPYLRSILKRNGFKLKRATHYKLRESELREKRDLAIVKIYLAGDNPENIAKSYNLTKTRVIQILKNNSVFNPKKINYVELQKVADVIRNDIAADVPYESVYLKEKYCENKKCTSRNKIVPQSIYKCPKCLRKLTGKKNTLIITGILDKYGKATIMKCKKLGINLFRETFDRRIKGVLKGLKANKSPLYLSEKYYCTRDYIYYIKTNYGK